MYLYTRVANGCTLSQCVFSSAEMASYRPGSGNVGGWTVTVSEQNVPHRGVNGLLLDTWSVSWDRLRSTACVLVVVLRSWRCDGAVLIGVVLRL